MAVKLVRRIVAWYRTSDSTLAAWVHAARDALLGEMPVLAAGTALFAILATVPTLAAVVGLYNLVADPHQIQVHIGGLAKVLPPAVADFIGDQLALQAQRSQGEALIAIIGSFVVAVFSARGAARGLIDTFNRAYRVREHRRPIVKLAITLAISMSTLLGLMVFFGVVVALPGILAIFHLEGYGFVKILRWPVLMAVLFGALLALYRYAPSPRPLGTRLHLWPGAAVATVLLFVVSLGLSLWVDRVANYALFYGAFGSVVVTILWFYLSVIALVLGGFANAELERHHGAPEPDRSMY
ncbi:MAG: YihY/virulence factor BrkB family protein [Deltaproteobacteria bacterium]|nr:YihY/virulence factor BrkB family protein [Deltaproteobacteria bacterium]